MLASNSDWLIVLLRLLSLAGLIALVYVFRLSIEIPSNVIDLIFVAPPIVKDLGTCTAQLTFDHKKTASGLSSSYIISQFYYIKATEIKNIKVR